MCMNISKEDMLRVNRGFGGGLISDSSLDFALDIINNPKLGIYKKLAYLWRAILVDHPFSDGNVRISRLMMNFVLNKYGFPMLDIPYTKRSGYYTALERSQLKNDEHIFVQWFFKKFIENNKRFL